MFRHSSSNSHTISIRLLLAVGLTACLVWLALSFFRGSLRFAGNSTSTTATRNSKLTNVGPGAAKLYGQDAHNYLAQSAEGQSLMTAMAKVRFGLERREKSPFGDASAGFLGMSHDENLNAWFDNEGVTVRPTVNEQERAKSWRMQMRLRAYGYGNELHEALKQTTPTAKENRIEYERARDDAGARVVEWYVNKSEGIEQGFTLEERPRRNADTSDNEPLRLSVSVTGDLRAHASDNGQSVELSKSGAGVLSYSELMALDARGQKLAARMETNELGDEIALVVEDSNAEYPIVVDPITATLKQELFGSTIQAEARFGFAVAIDNNIAVVGAWREDNVIGPDQGAVYTFNLQTNWVFETKLATLGDFSSSAQCGWSVDVHSNGIIVGCPGFFGQGAASFYRRTSPGSYSFSSIPPLAAAKNGDRYGESVAIGEGRNGGWDFIIGSPFADTPTFTDIGVVNFLQYDSSLVLTSGGQFSSPGTPVSNAQFGTSVAVDSGRAVVGRKVGDVRVYQRPPAGNYISFASLVGDSQVPTTDFGNRVAISGDTVVVGAPLFDTNAGQDAGAVYVYDLGLVTSETNTLTGLKLTASDGKASDLFGEHGLAIEGNTIVVGAYANGQGGDPLNGIPDDDRGAVYVFTRNGASWTQQTKISQGNFQGGEAGDHFGIDVDISNNYVIIGARAASAPSVLRSGAAFIYELNCVPPQITSSTPPGHSETQCEGSVSTNMFFVNASAFGSSPTYQWRKNGVNVPGATNSAIGFFPVGVSPSDAGTYDVVVSNSCGSEIVGPFTLIVNSFNINPTSQGFTPSGGNGSINVTQPPCSWNAASDASFVTITSGTFGNANGNILYSVSPNSGSSQRMGHINVSFGGPSNPPRVFTIVQDGTAPAIPTLQFSQASYNAGEAAGNVDVTVTRTGNTTSAVTVDYATTDGTATDRGDYTTALGKLRFNAGETAKTFRVFITDDVYVEGTQSLNLTLLNATGGATIGSPSTATLSITDNDSAPPSTNPLDTTAFFVRQHYVDFLLREPDASGLSFWINNIDSCGANVSCREVKRIDTSAAFFLSIEFQETGFLVHRLYRASFNRLTRYREFIRDSQEMGRGVVVNSPGWEAALEANKQAFISEFIARTDFQAIYGGMTNAQYVDALNTNTGNSLSTTERNALVTGLNGGTETRATALRKVAEDGDFRARETSPAFVLMQYFGYLRRNPDDSPEPGLNFDGYNFWLNKLNSFGGDFRAAEMVKAFITSGEYRARFGP